MLVSLDVYNGQVFDSRPLERIRGYLSANDFREIMGDYQKALNAGLAKLADKQASAVELRIALHDVLNFAGTLGLFELKAPIQSFGDDLKRNGVVDEPHLSAGWTSSTRAVSVLDKFLDG